MTRVLGDAVFLPLGRKKGSQQERFSLVDIEDYARVSEYRWHMAGGWLTKYAVTCSNRIARHHKKLHSLILRTQYGQMVDHISGDSLDNRKQNLRLCTAAENCQNARRPSFPGKTSRFKGVAWSRKDGEWRAGITSDGNHYFLGLFGDETEAARAYDKAALEHHGEFARTNETMKLYEMPDPFVPDCSGAEHWEGFIPHSTISAKIHPWSIKPKLVKGFVVRPERWPRTRKRSYFVDR